MNDADELEAAQHAAAIAQENEDKYRRALEAISRVPPGHATECKRIAREALYGNPDHIGKELEQ